MLKPSSVRGYLAIEKFEDPQLCPMRTLKCYLDKVRYYLYTCLAYKACLKVRPQRTKDPLFLGLRPPHLPVTARTLARWLTALMSQAGIDVSIFCQHSTRAASANFQQKEMKLSVKEILVRADWSSKSGIFEKFYKRYIEK